MRLSGLLRGFLQRYVGNGTFERIDSLREADAVRFLCPRCLSANGGPRGTHPIRIDFADRAVPDDFCNKNSDGKAVRWRVSGSSLEDITLAPSILIQGHCCWHGFVENGQTRDA